MITDRYSRPIGRLSQYAAPGACSLLAAITFLREQEDITDPDAAVGVAGKRPHAFRSDLGQSRNGLPTMATARIPSSEQRL